MASKKDRKVVRREGVPSSGSEVHKLAELEACQRLLEIGCIGPRFYNGPHIAGSFFTFQDRLLDEVRWLAVDVFEQKKLAIAHCRLISSSIHKYWLERSRGCLADAAGMIQSYWQSVAKEVRASGRTSTTGVFKLGTLQGMGPLTSAFSSASPSLVPTPSEEEAPKASSFLQSQVREWLDARASLNPPIAETSTSMAEYCVQVVKQLSPHRDAEFSSEKCEEDSSSPVLFSPALDFFIPIDSFLPTTRSHVLAQSRAIEGAIQSSLAATRGVDCGLEPRRSDSLLRPPILHAESQRSILVEMLVTNVMSRNPQLFRLAVSSSAKDAGAKKNNALKKIVPENAPLVPSKHYFVSVIFSSFRPLPWTLAEDEVLLSVSQTSLLVNWALVAATVNWTATNSLRTGSQCHDRFLEIQQSAGSKKNKLSSFSVVPLARRKQREVFVRVKKLAAKSPALLAEVHYFPRDKSCQEIVPFERCGLTGRPSPPGCVVLRDAMPRPAYTKLAASPKKSEPNKPLLPQRSSSSPKRDEETYMLQRPAQMPPAFALEEMLRKNPLAVGSLTPQFLTGEEVCARHPSFANISRIAEITLTRLVNSLDEGVSISGPVSVKELFGFCAKFRLKYPAIFTSHQTPQKPFMPPLRQTAPNNASSKMLTRAMTHNDQQQQSPYVGVTSIIPPSAQPTPQPSVLPVKKELVKVESMDSLAAAGPVGPGWILPRRARSAATRGDL